MTPTVSTDRFGTPPDQRHYPHRNGPGLNWTRPFALPLSSAAARLASDRVFHFILQSTASNTRPLPSTRLVQRV